MNTVVKLVYFLIVSICLVFSSSSFADKPSTSYESIHSITNIPSQLAPDSVSKCKQISNNIDPSASANSLKVAQGDVYDREPNCCGQCNTPSGMRGCNVYINGEWVCSGC